ncbi:unnamed protein product [Rhizophagus irregularis]|nr:unnamed protein product [Rhizophagus irregularis]
MCISRGQTLTGKKVIFKEKRYCMHSEIVKEKQGSKVIKIYSNHIPTFAKLLGFCPVSKIIQDRYIELFKIGHSPATTIHTYENSLHLAAVDEKELITLLADRTTNSNYDFVNNLFKKYKTVHLGERNESNMFEKLQKEVQLYNEFGLGSAILHQYNKELEQLFVFAIITNIMKKYMKELDKQEKYVILMHHLILIH